MKSRSDLIRRVIALLGEVFPGQIATDDDRASIDGYIDGKVEELANRKIVYIADADQIDEQLFEHLAVLVANAARAEYRQPRDDAAEMRAERRLRDIDRLPFYNDVLATSYI